MDIYQSLLDGNKAWVKETLDKDPEFFERLSKGQSPQTLWIDPGVEGFWFHGVIRLVEQNSRSPRRIKSGPLLILNKSGQSKIHVVKEKKTAKFYDN